MNDKLKNASVKEIVELLKHNVINAGEARTALGLHDRFSLNGLKQAEVSQQMAKANLDLDWTGKPINPLISGLGKIDINNGPIA